MIKVYKKNVVACLRDLASSDFQKQAWLASSGPVVSSFVEDVCQLFDDTGLGDALKANEAVFGSDTDKCLRELSAIIDKVNHNVSPEKLLNDPLIQAVRKKADEALKLIQSGAA